MNGSLFVYGIGTALVIAAVVLGARELGVPDVWLLITGLLVAGIGIRGAASVMRQQERENQSRND